MLTFGSVCLYQFEKGEKHHYGGAGGEKDLKINIFEGVNV